jgi:hypothetical protein
MITFTSADTADRVADANEQSPFTFGGSELLVRFGALTRLKPPSRVLFVGNFGPDYDTLEHRLRTLFAPYSKALRFRIGEFINHCLR